MKLKMIVGVLGILMCERMGGAATVAQFNFDSISVDRKTVTDISGNSHDATFNRAVSCYAADPFSKGLNSSTALSINTTMAYLANPGTINLSGNQFTLEGWIKPTSVNSHQTLLQIDCGSSAKYFLGIYSDSTYIGRPIARMYASNTWFTALGSTTLEVNQWVHLAAVYNDSADGYLRLYVNGTELSNVYIGKSLGTPTSVYFGGGGNLGQVLGNIDDLRISNTALAPSELGYHQSFTTAQQPSAIAKFNFDTIGTDYKRIPDVSYNNHDMVFNRHTYTSPDDPFSIDSSRSVYVNDIASGELAYLDNPSTINLSTRNQFTMECRFKPEAYYDSTLMYLQQTVGGTFNAILCMKDTGQVQVKFYVSGTWYPFDGPTLNLDTWYHLALTYDGSTLHLYVNGVEEGSCYVGKSLPTSLSSVILGGGGGFGNSDGWFDDVAIYDWAKEAGDFALTESFTPGTVYANSYGFTAEDATDALQKAIDSGASTVIVRNMGSPWYVAKTIAVNFRSYLTLNFESGVQVRDKDGAFWSAAASGKLFQINGGDHITFDGAGAEFKMRKSQYLAAPYEPSEFRIALAIYDASDVTVRGLAIRDSGGDGIYINTESYGGISIENVLLDNHYRNGLTVISTGGLTLDHVTIQNTNGTAPRYGIDFEPNNSSEQLTNIVVQNCTLTDNAAGAIIISPGILNETSQPVSITIKDTTIEGGNRGISWLENGQANSGRTGSVLVERVSITGIGTNAIDLTNKTSDPGIDLHFKDVQVAASADSAVTKSPILFSGVAEGENIPNSPLGNVWFETVTVTDTVDRPFLNANSLAQTLGIRNVTGLFTVNSPFTPTWTLGSNLTNVNIQLTGSTPLPGDANHDNKVDVGDLGILAANYGRNLQTQGVDPSLWWSLGDFNNDGKVDVGDLGILAANYGSSRSSFEADYAKVFGAATEDEENEEESSNSLCSGLGLPMIVGLALMGLMLVKLDE